MNAISTLFCVMMGYTFYKKNAFHSKINFSELISKTTSQSESFLNVEVKWDLWAELLPLSSSTGVLALSPVCWQLETGESRGDWVGNVACVRDYVCLPVVISPWLLQGAGSLLLWSALVPTPSLLPDNVDCILLILKKFLPTYFFSWRARTKIVYSMYSRKAAEDVKKELMKLKVNYYILEESWCTRRSKWVFHTISSL